MKNIILLLVMSISVSGCRDGYFFGAEQNICVKSKEIMLNNSDQGIYREKIIFAEDDVYTVEDSLFALSYDSLSTYNKLDTSKCYTVIANSGRFGFLNMKRNIIKVIGEVK